MAKTVSTMMQVSAVRAYLKTLEEQRASGKRGYKRSPEMIQRRIDKIDELYANAGVVSAVKLLQERRDLEDLLLTAEDDDDAACAGFVKHAKAWSEKEGITYATWREIGVPVAVLKEAGITRGAK